MTPNESVPLALAWGDRSASAPMTLEREAELREDATELDHGQLVRALREALDAMAFERTRADAAAERRVSDLKFALGDGAGWFDRYRAERNSADAAERKLAQIRAIVAPDATCPPRVE